MVDEFIIYDDMQFTRRDWRNRNKIKTKDGIHWLTIPVDVKVNTFRKLMKRKLTNLTGAKTTGIQSFITIKKLPTTVIIRTHSNTYTLITASNS